VEDASASAPASDAAPLFGGRYRYVRTLRTGPSCHVIEARDELLLRAGGDAPAAASLPLVAVKIMHAHAAACGVAQAAALRALARADPAAVAKLPRLAATFRYGGAGSGSGSGGADGSAVGAAAAASGHVCLVLPRLYDSVRDRLRAGRLPTVRRSTHAANSALSLPLTHACALPFFRRRAPLLMAAPSRCAACARLPRSFLARWPPATPRASRTAR
jgi:hypothetical protein